MNPGGHCSFCDPGLHVHVRICWEATERERAAREQAEAKLAAAYAVMDKGANIGWGNAVTVEIVRQQGLRTQAEVRAESAEKERDALCAALEQEKKWKVEDPRMLREQIRVADLAFNHLHVEHAALKLKLEAAKGQITNLLRVLPHDQEGAARMNAAIEEAREALSQLNDESKLVDYWCRDCQGTFRAPFQPEPHAKQVKCPKGHVNNAYEAHRDDVSKREEDDSN